MKKIIVFGEALFASQSALEILTQNHWDYPIQFSKNKLKLFAELLNLRRVQAQSIPGQTYCRERHQEFYWYCDVIWSYDGQLKIHVVSCVEK